MPEAPALALNEAPALAVPSSVRLPVVLIVAAAPALREPDRVAEAAVIEIEPTAPVPLASRDASGSRSSVPPTVSET